MAAVQAQAKPYLSVPRRPGQKGRGHHWALRTRNGLAEAFDFPTRARKLDVGSGRGNFCGKSESSFHRAARRITRP